MVCQGASDVDQRHGLLFGLQLLLLVSTSFSQYTSPADTDFPYLGFMKSSDDPQPHHMECLIACGFGKRGLPNAPPDSVEGMTIDIDAIGLGGGTSRSITFFIRTLQEFKIGENNPASVLALGTQIQITIIRGRLGFVISTNAGLEGLGNGGSRVDDGMWHHVALTMDAAVVRCYIDGQLDRLYNLSSTLWIMQYTGSNYIAMSNTPRINFVGELRNLFLYDTLLFGGDVAYNRFLSHDKTKCRKITIYSYDPDCVGPEYNTWCADGYQKVYGNDSLCLSFENLCTWQCLAPTQATTIPSVVMCNHSCNFDGTPYSPRMVPVEALPSGNLMRAISFFVRTLQTDDLVTLISLGDTARAMEQGIVNFSNMFGVVMTSGYITFPGLPKDMIGQIRINDGKWHHIAAVYDSEMLEAVVYIDGIRDFKLYVGIPNLAWKGFLNISAGSSGMLSPWSIGLPSYVGELLNVQFFNQRITLTQILLLNRAYRESGLVWVEAPTTYSWSDAAQRCTDWNMILASYEDYCPTGAIAEQTPRGGVYEMTSGSVWAPFAGAGPNAWVDLSRTNGAPCLTHGVIGEDGVPLFPAVAYGLVYRPEWGTNSGTGADKNRQVLCKVSGALDSPVKQFGPGWELYLFNGAGKSRSAELRYNANPGGFGEVGPLKPQSGGHKMSEATFNSRCFRQVLAVGSDDRWALVKRRDGGCIPAVDAFAVSTAPGYNVTMSSGCTANSEECPLASTRGPFFCTCGGANLYMWSKLNILDTYIPNQWSTKHGTLNPILTSGASYTWAWYGRADPPTTISNGVGYCEHYARDGLASPGSYWMLFMYDGKDTICNRRSQLKYGANVNGLGNILQKPVSGAHKMSEIAFDAYRFTEILLQDHTNAWAICRRRDGSPFTADVAFAERLVAAAQVNCTRSDGLVGSAGLGQSNFGPLLDANWGDDCQHHWYSGCAKGTVYGRSRGLGCSDIDPPNGWAYYGRSTTYCSASSLKSKALSFTGNQWLQDDGADMPQYNAPYTWELWLRTYGKAGTAIAYGSAVAFESGSMYFGDDNSAHNYWPNIDLRGDVTVRWSEWTHVALTWDGFRRKFYFNGTLVGADVRFPYDVEQGPLVLGAQGSMLLGRGGFWGELYEVRVWSSSLSQNQFGADLDLYSPPLDLVRWYRFDQSDSLTSSVHNYATSGPSSAQFASRDKPKWVQAFTGTPGVCVDIPTSLYEGPGAYSFGTGALWDPDTSSLLAVTSAQKVTLDQIQALTVPQNMKSLLFEWKYLIGPCCQNCSVELILNGNVAWTSSIDTTTKLFATPCPHGDPCPFSSAAEVAVEVSGMVQNLSVSWRFSTDQAPIYMKLTSMTWCPEHLNSPRRLAGLDGGGWKIVRHCAAGSRWCRATDRLRGGDVYGDLSLGDGPANVEWSVEFDNIEFDEFLFASGDGMRWLIVPRFHVIGMYELYAPRYVSKSSGNGSPHILVPLSEIEVSNNASAYGPMIYVKDNGQDLLLYAGGKLISGSENLMATVKKFGGVNVFVRSSSVKHRATCQEMITDTSVWGRSARGIDVSDSTAQSLKWLGCADGINSSCSPSSFYCNDLTQGIEFGTTQPGSTLRALIVSQTAAVPQSLSNGSSSCCSLQSPMDPCDVMSQDIDITRLCVQLGYTNGVILEWEQHGACPPVLHAGTWTASFAMGLGNGVGSRFRCYEASVHVVEIINNFFGSRVVSTTRVKGNLSYAPTVEVMSPEVPDGGLWEAKLKGAAAVGNITAYNVTKKWWIFEEWAGKFRIMTASGARLHEDQGTVGPKKGDFGVNFTWGRHLPSEWWTLDRYGDKYRIANDQSSRRLVASPGRSALGTRAPNAIVPLGDDFIRQESFWTFVPDPWVKSVCLPSLRKAPSNVTQGWWSVVGNIKFRLGPLSYEQDMAYLGTERFRDGRLKLRVNLHSAFGSVGVAMRASEAYATYYECRLDANGSLGSVAFVKSSGPGAPSFMPPGQVLLRGPNFTKPSGRNILLEMRISANTFFCYVDGVSMGQLTDFAFSYGSLALTVWNTTARFTILKMEGPTPCSTSQFLGSHWMVTPQDFTSTCSDIEGLMPSTQFDCFAAARYLDLDYMDLPESQEGLLEGPLCGTVEGVVRWNRFGTTSSTWGWPWSAVCQEAAQFSQRATTTEEDPLFVQVPMGEGLDTERRGASTIMLNFSQCADRCSAIGRRMPCLTDADSENYFRLVVGTQGGWLGFYSPQGSLSWRWPDDCPSDYTNWDSLQPSDVTQDEICAVLAEWPGYRRLGVKASSCSKVAPCFCESFLGVAEATAPFASFCDLSPCSFHGTDNETRQLPETALIPDDYPRTVAMIIRTHMYATTGSLFVTGSMNPMESFGLQLQDGYLGFDVWSYPGELLGGTIKVNDDISHHVVVTYESGALTLYVDGVLDYGRNLSVPLRTTQSYTNYLGRALFPGQYFMGNISKVRLYDYAMSSDAVRNLAEAEVTRAPTASPPVPTPTNSLGFLEIAGPSMVCVPSKWLRDYLGSPMDCAHLVVGRIDCSHNYFVHRTEGNGDCACVDPKTDCSAPGSQVQDYVARNPSFIYQLKVLISLYIGESCAPISWLAYQPSAADCGNAVADPLRSCSSEYFVWSPANNANCGCVARGTNCRIPSNRANSIDTQAMSVYTTQELPPPITREPTSLPTSVPMVSPTRQPTIGRCGAHTCPANSVTKMNSLMVIGDTDEVCCDLLCSGFQCGSGMVVIPDANFVRAFTSAECCVDAPTAIPTVRPTWSPTADPTRRPTLSPSFAPTKVPTEGPTPHPTQPVDPMARGMPKPPTYIGQGFCRSVACVDRATCGNLWNSTSDCLSRESCEARCANSTACRGFAWAKVPKDDIDGCREARLPRCVIYLGSDIVSMTKSTNSEYECYASIEGPSLQMTVRVTGFDYDKFLQNVSASDEFLNVISYGVAQDASVATRFVRILHWRGSIMMTVVITAPEDISLSTLRGILRSEDNVEKVILRSIYKVSEDSLLAIMTPYGNISVTTLENLSTQVLTVTPATPSPTPVPTMILTYKPTEAPTRGPTVLFDIGGQSGNGLGVVLISIVASVLGCCLVCCGTYCYWRHRRKRSSARIHNSEILDSPYEFGGIKQQGDLKLRNEKLKKKSARAGSSVTSSRHSKSSKKVEPNFSGKHRHSIALGQISLADGDDVDDDPSYVPSYWVNQDLTVEYIRWEEVFGEVTEVLTKAIQKTFTKPRKEDRPKHTDLGKRRPVGVEVVTINRVENLAMWRRYAERRQQISEQRMPACQPIVRQGLAFEFAPLEFLSLKSMVNEHFLLVGTSPQAAASITSTGFATEFKRGVEDALYGDGIYLTEFGSEADLDAKEDLNGPCRGSFAMLVCRATLGECYKTDNADAESRTAAKEAIEMGTCDSLLGEPVNPDKKKGMRQFVIPDCDQVYPEYVVIYKRLMAKKGLFVQQKIDGETSSETEAFLPS